MTVQLKRNDTKDTISYPLKNNDGTIVNLTGATVRFVMGIGNTLITNAPATIADAAGGIAEYTLTDADTLVAGNLQAEFEVTFSDGKVKTFPNDGYISVKIKSNIDKDKSTYVEDAIALRVSDIEVFKNDVNAKVDQASADAAKVNLFQTQIDQLVIEGDSSVESAQARVEADGTTNTTLKARLDKKEAETKTLLAEKATKTELNLSPPYLTHFFKALEKGSATIVFLGDSLTAANEPNNFYSHPEYLQAWFDTKYGTGKVTVINAGNGGQDARMMCSRLARDVINKNPDVVVISSGWNDIGLGHTSTYELYMNRMVDLIKKSTKKPVDIILRTTNIGTSSNMPLLRAEITPTIHRVAKRNNIQVFDLLGIMDRDIANGTIVLSNILAVGDDKHYNGTGQEYIANQFKTIFDNTIQLTKQSEAPQFVSDFDYIPATDSRVTISGFASGVTASSYYIYDISAGVSSYSSARSATLKFFGNRVGVAIQVGESSGMLDVTIDGVSNGTIDLFEEQDNVTYTNNLKIVYFEGLSDGEHTIVLSHSSLSNPLSTGTAIIIMGFIVDKKFSAYYKVAPKLTQTKLYYNAADKATRLDVISNTTAFVLPFDRIQTNNGTTSAVADNAITVADAGFYHALGSVKTLAGNIDGKLYIRVNGGNRCQKTVEHSATYTGDRIDQISAQLWLNAGDKVTLVYQRMTSDNVSIKYDDNDATSLKIVKTL